MIYTLPTRTVSEIRCLNCGTKWQEKSVTLNDGTFYNLEEDGRWMRGPNKPKLSMPITIPVSRFFGEEE